MDKSTVTQTKVKKGTTIQWNELHKGAVLQRFDQIRGFKRLSRAKKYCILDLDWRLVFASVRRLPINLHNCVCVILCICTVT